VRPQRRFGRRRAGDVEDEWLRQGYWIARTADQGDGTRRVKTFGARGTMNGTRFERGEVAIAVKWWDRVPSDSRGLSFVEWHDEQDVDDTFVVNSSQIRLVPTLTRVEPIAPAFEPLTREGRRRSPRTASVSEAPAKDVYTLTEHEHLRIRETLTAESALARA